MKKASKEKKKRSQQDTFGPQPINRFDNLWISKLGCCAGPLVIAVVSVAMLVWLWRSWPDVLIDFGRELYIAWQLAEGKALYTDIAYFNGPLSPYLNSIWFRLFGVSLTTLIVCNIIIVTVLIVLLYWVLMEIGDRISATVACITFATIFAFGNLLSVGNYNYICPYSHEMVHGMVLGMSSIWFLSIYHRFRKMICLAGTGLALGLAFLTKAEMFLAGVTAVCAALGLTIWSEQPSWKRLVKILGMFVGSAVLPVAIAFGLLSLAMPANRALQGTMGSWLWIGNEQISSLTFYRWVMGVDHPWENIKKLLLWTIWFSAIFIPTGLVGMKLRKEGHYRIVVAIMCFTITAVVLGLSQKDISWGDVVRPLPLLMLILAVGTFIVLIKHPRQRQLCECLIVRLGMAIFAFALLGKIILYTRVYHYGFVLAMPATLLLVVMLTCWIPNWMSRRGGYGGFFRAVGLGVLLIYILAHLQIINFRLSKKTYVVSRGVDTFFATRKGYAVNLLLNRVAQQVKPKETLAVLPEGIMINYLCRRVNPTPYINFMPPEMIIFGEDKMLASFQENRPDYIALVHKNTVEYGSPFFGRDYGQQLFEWIENNYNPIHQIGAPPLRDWRFGILLMQAKELQ